jgi:hypothetical protein
VTVSTAISQTDALGTSCLTFEENIKEPTLIIGQASGLVFVLNYGINSFLVNLTL